MVKKKVVDDQSEPLKPGETRRYECNGCSREFEVTMEPKAKGDPRGAEMTDSARVNFCPFCRSESFEEV